MRAEALTGYLGWSLGLLERAEPCPAGELVARFAWDKVRRETWVVPADFRN